MQKVGDCASIVIIIIIIRKWVTVPGQQSCEVVSPYYYKVRIPQICKTWKFGCLGWTIL